MKKILLAGVIGATVAFMWGSFSWLVLPWHAKSFKEFNEAEKIGEVLKKHAQEPGMYLLPSGSEEDSFEKMVKGPFLFGSFRADERKMSMGSLMAKNFAYLLVGAFLLLFVMSRMRFENWREQVLSFLAISLFGGVISHMNYWNWWEFSTYWTFQNILDGAIAWTLAGMAMKKFLPQFS